MPASLRAWYTPADFEALAVRQAELCGDFLLADMPRLAEYLGTEAGTVGTQFALSQGGPGWIRLIVTIQAKLCVPCQRCLGPLELEITERVEFGVLADEHSAGHLPDGIEPVVRDGDRISPQRLIEDEMIVAVPLVPKHAREHCVIDDDTLPEGVFTGSGAAKTN